MDQITPRQLKVPQRFPAFTQLMLGVVRQAQRDNGDLPDRLLIVNQQSP
jgi:hypothetical protein